MYEAHFKPQQWDFMPNRCLKLLFIYFFWSPAVAAYTCEFTKIFKLLGTFAAAGAGLGTLAEFSNEPLITAAASPFASWPQTSNRIIVRFSN